MRFTSCHSQPRRELCPACPPLGTSHKHYQNNNKQVSSRSLPSVASSGSVELSLVVLRTYYVFKTIESHKTNSQKETSEKEYVNNNPHYVPYERSASASNYRYVQFHPLSPEQPLVVQRSALERFQDAKSASFFVLRNWIRTSNVNVYTQIRKLITSFMGDSMWQWCWHPW